LKYTRDEGLLSWNMRRGITCCLAVKILERLRMRQQNNNGSSYIAHFTNVSMRFTTRGGLFRAAYYGALAAKQLTIMRN
jgi:hypothetical protein